MTLQQIYQQIPRFWELRGELPLTWRYPVTPTVDPLAAQYDPAWPAWDPEQPNLRKREKNWYYAEIVIPEEINHVPLAGDAGQIFINGYAPFTLWINGEEAYRETHAWHATGPIADPLPAPLAPGETLRLIACIEPTELPAGSPPFNFSLHSARAMELAIDMNALTAQLMLADRLAVGEEERARVEAVAALIDQDALAEQRWEKVLAAVPRIEAELAFLSPRAKALTVHLIGHTHIDMDWMWTWDDTVHCARRDFKAVADILDDYPEVTFSLSQAPLYQIVQQYDPDVFARVQAFIRAGRWECVAATWVEGDLNMADGESVARHMLYATDWAKDTLGVQAKTLWEPDTFGHPGNMPQLARLGECDCYFHWRDNPGGAKNWPARNWTGIDGTSIPAYSRCYGAWLVPVEMVGSLGEYQDSGLTDALFIWGLGDHGGGLPRHGLEMMKRYRDRPLMPTLRFSTMAEFNAAIGRQADKLPGNTGETYHLFEGCFTTHAEIKRYNRACEGALLVAETMSALAGRTDNDALREVWKDILFNQFHDIFDGAAVHDSYLNAYARAESALATAREVTDSALAALVEPAADGQSLTIYNPLGFAFIEPVRVALPDDATHLEDAAGHLIPVQRMDDSFIFLATAVPAFSKMTYRIVRGESAKETVAVTEEATCFTVDTPLLTVKVLKDSGAIGFYHDNTLGRDIVNYGVPKHLSHVPNSRADLALNVFTVIDEAPNRMTAWLISDHLREERLLRGAEVSLLETGPVFARLRVRHAFRSSYISEDIIIYRQFPRLDFVATVDWREQGNATVGVPQLKVGFNTAMSAARAKAEGPFTVVEHPADGQEQPTQKWAGLDGDGFGVTLFNDSKYGYDALGSRLRLTLLRNPYGPDPEPDNGVHVICFGFLAHGPVAHGQRVMAGMAFNRPLLAARTDAAPVTGTPALRIEEGQFVVCTALRRAEHSDRLLLRFFEAGGQPCPFRFTFGNGIRAAEEVNFHETPVAGAFTLQDGMISTTLRGFEVKTFAVEVE